MTAPRAAEATSSGSGSRAGCIAEVIPSSFSLATAEGASVSSRIFTSSLPIRSADTVASASEATASRASTSVSGSKPKPRRASNLTPRRSRVGSSLKLWSWSTRSTPASRS